MALPVTFHFPTNKTWAVGRCQGPMEQHGQAHSEPCRDPGASPHQCVAATSHHSLCASLSPRLPSRGGKAPAGRAWNLLSAHSWLPTAPGAQEGAFHHGLRLAPLPVPAKGHTSLVAVTRGGIRTPVHSSVPCFLFQTAIVPQLLGAVGHMQATVLPRGTAQGPSSHAGRPLHLRVHKQVTGYTVVSPDLAHATPTSQDPVTGRAQETCLAVGEVVGARVERAFHQEKVPVSGVRAAQEGTW